MERILFNPNVLGFSWMGIYSGRFFLSSVSQFRTKNIKEAWVNIVLSFKRQAPEVRDTASGGLQGHRWDSVSQGRVSANWAASEERGHRAWLQRLLMAGINIDVLTKRVIAGQALGEGRISSLGVPWGSQVTKRWANTVSRLPAACDPLKDQPWAVILMSPVPGLWEVLNLMNNR